MRLTPNQRRHLRLILLDEVAPVEGIHDRMRTESDRESLTVAKALLRQLESKAPEAKG